MKTRNGKIARLPRPIREHLNRRLDDGEPGPSLLRWLNELPAVREVLDRDFGGRPVTEQNLSEWRQGGFQDWLKHQEEVDWATTLVDKAQALEEAGGSASLADHLATVATLEMARLLNDAKPDGDPAERRKTVLAVTAAVANLRRVQIEAVHARIKAERWEKERAHEEQEEKNRQEQEQKDMPQKLIWKIMAEKNFISSLGTFRTPEEAASLRAMYEELKKQHRRPQPSADDPSPRVIPPSRNPTKSR